MLLLKVRKNMSVFYSYDCCLLDLNEKGSDN